MPYNGSLSIFVTRLKDDTGKRESTDSCCVSGCVCAGSRDSSDRGNDVGISCRFYNILLAVLIHGSFILLAAE